MKEVIYEERRKEVGSESERHPAALSLPCHRTSPQPRYYEKNLLEFERFPHLALAKTYNLHVDTARGSTDLGFVQVGTWWWYPAPGSTGERIEVEHYFRGETMDD